MAIKTQTHQVENLRKKRPNRHSKKKSSKIKTSKNYKKAYKGQGR
jgi:hypothetical protein